MILTNAVSGIARSGATRSGYPVLQGAKVPLYALSNVARSGATRSNYVGRQAFINIGGIDYGWGGVIDDGVGILAESLTKADAINNTPVTLQFTARGWVPVEGSDVVVTLGSKNNQRREFGGTILSTHHRYVGDKPVAANMLYDVACIDYTWALDRRKASGNYTNASLAAVAASLLTFAPAGYTLRIDPDIGAAILDQITFTEQTLSSAFAQLAKRVGGDFLCDFAKVVHLFFENTALTPPRIVNAVHPSLATIAFTRDLSPVATRVLGNFGGSNALDQIAPGATLLPVETAAWYLPAGGVVLVGQQRVNYSGLVVGGGGSLVGPGASPTGLLNVALQPGAGVDVGVHDYAVTYKTAAGESVVGPRVTVPVGVFLPPTTAPTPGAPGGGATGPDPGVHDYAVSFVISTGETVPGPRVSVSTDLTPPPTTAPTPDRVDPGPGPDPGAHDYAVAFVTATGATPAGPIGSQITTGLIQTPIGAPTSAPTVTETAGSDGVFGGAYHLYVTFVTAAGETTVGPGVPFNAVLWPNNRIDLSNIPRGPAGVTARNIYSKADSTNTVFVNTLGDNTSTTYHLTSGTQYSTSGQIGPPSNTAGTSPSPNQTVHLSGIPTGPAAVTGRALYRRSGGAVLRFVATIAGNSTTTYTDTTPNASLGAVPPTVNTATLRQIPLTAIPLGNSLVLGRKIYRTPTTTGTLQLVAALNDNTTTAFTDTVNDASLGAAALTVGTAQAAQAQLTAIPLGAASVTSRVIYRTKAGQSQLQLVAELTNNVITQYLDTKPDATLGANAPTSDLSGLQQPNGIVQIGSLTLPVASVGAFLPTGGWAIVGGLNLRYTGISGNALLGIPASGPGSISATITFNTTAVAAAMLTGIPTTGLGVIQYTVLKGDPVNVWVQVDNLAAQAAVRAQLPGSDGIIEDEIQDGRLSYTEGRARCQARLDLLSELDSDGNVGVLSVTYVCRDINALAGATATINLGPPINLRGDFLIQRVSVAQFNVPHLNPTYTVEASSIRFSAEEMLRLLRQGAM